MTYAEEPRTFYSADLHFWHRKANELCGRPFTSVEKMNEGIIRRWNSVVRPVDWVYLLGDVCFQLGTPGRLDIVRRLNGVILLVPGNHDKCHPMYGAKTAAWRERYLRAGFAAVCDATHRKFIGDRWVLLSHFPYEGDSHDDDRFTAWRPVDVDGNTFVVCGHVHQAWGQKGYQINVGMDAHNGYPVPEEDVAARIYAGPADVAAIPWQSS